MLLARVATGDDINEAFFMNIKLDETQDNDLGIPQCSSIQEPSLQQIQHDTNPSSCSQEITIEFPDQYKNVVAEFKTEIQRFTHLFEMNPTFHNLRALTNFTKIIKKINTSEQGQPNLGSRWAAI